MNKEQILALPITALGLPGISLAAILRLFFFEEEFRGDYTAQGRLNCIERKLGHPLTVADIIKKHDDGPLKVDAFNSLKSKLLQLGLTSMDWPPLAKDTKATYQAAIDRARGSKEKILALPVYFFIHSRYVLEELWYRVKEHGIPREDFFKVLISDILDFRVTEISSFDGHEKSLSNLIDGLLDAGLTPADGRLFYNEKEVQAKANRVIAVSRIRDLLELTQSQVDKLLKLFEEEKYPFG